MPENPILIVGPPGSGKTQRAHEAARKIGCPYSVISFEEFIKYKTWLHRDPDTKAVIVDEIPPGEWGKHVSVMRHMFTAATIACEVKGKDPVQVPAPRFILTCTWDFSAHQIWGRQEFEVIRLGRRPGNPGTPRTLEPKCCRSIQRYKQKDYDLIREVSEGNVSTFVHDAAVARAKRLSEGGHQQMIEWININNELPQDGELVLIFTTETNVKGCNGRLMREHVATFRKGRTAAEVELSGKCACFDEYGNNKRPFGWDGDGPCKWFGQEVTHWARITIPKEASEPCQK